MFKRLTMYYTYAYLRDDKTPYYIGKGCGERAWCHGKGEVMPPKDKTLILILKKDLSEQEAFRHEIYMISVFGRKNNNTGILRNRTDGGEGSRRKQSEKTKKKIGDAHRGKKMPESAKQRIREHRTGSTLSKEHKQKISQSLKGEKNPLYGLTGDQHPHYGKKRSKEARENIRQAALRRWERHRGENSEGTVSPT